MIETRTMKPVVLHISAVPHISEGILQQLEQEKKAAQELSIPWTTTLFSPRPNAKAIESGLQVVSDSPSWLPKMVRNSRLGNAFVLRYGLHKWLLKNQHKYDLILFRYIVHDPWLLRSLRVIDIPVGLVHHTLEVCELQGHPWPISWVRSLLEKFLGPKVLKQADFLVGVTPEILDYELDRSQKYGQFGFLYPNGGTTYPNSLKDLRGESPEFMFVASYFSNWHGLDKLLKCMQQDRRPFTLHLIGSVSDADRKVALKDDRVILHGSLSANEIEDIGTRAWLSFASLALERMGMSQACPLKTRTSLAQGIPVYGSHADIFPKDFEYYHQGEVSLEEIIRCAFEWRKASRKDVRDTSLQFISKPQILNRLYIELSTTFG